MSVTFGFSIITLSKLKINDKFWILMKSRCSNCPWFLNLIKKWLRNQRLQTILFQFWWKDVNFWNETKCAKPSISQPILHQIQHSGGVSESSGQADSKTVIGIPIWPRFDRENKETFCLFSNDQHCINCSNLPEISQVSTHV